MSDSMYPGCGMCKGRGTLLPVEMGQDSEAGVVYRCTNPSCNVRFTKHGYARFDTKKQCWALLEDG